MLLVDYHAIVVTVDHDGPTASQVDIFLPPITDLEPKQSKYPFRSLKAKRSGVKEKTTTITIHTPIHLHFYVFQRMLKIIFQTCLEKAIINKVGFFWEGIIVSLNKLVSDHGCLFK